jgi:cell fate (sporulation/competence/biofilm development) regulator YlbF (YheA/YmcA/DUF963 family)
MQNNDSIILNKTRELCQTILESPDMATVRNRINSFLADENAKLQYQQVSEKMDFLNQKKNMGVEITDQEIDDFNADRQALLSNPLAKGFLEAQQEVQQVQDLVSQFVAKTFELGRVPKEEDFSSGSCGTGCGCH